MLSGAHVILYSRDAEADRTFVRDVLGLAGVDAGDGWLIFRLPPAELAVHPTDGESKAEFYLMCDDIEGLLARLAGEGVVVASPVTDQGWGLLASIRLPSGADLAIYEPRHPLAHDLPG
jgi:catechol 2,3-dioxygenase-like lactoylglutathione lyase family enzyme